ncbi:SMG9-like protein [Euroglyphus maynei]|uniref:SMG9-like protein n=1 Tax=Euroglyphus maynei TaxID=6958 RepID=A0A1Y3ARP3_EURMA|nr:SMG9-like protein [Euroglyphus maynei]
MSTAIFSQVVGFDIAETENFAFIYSLQMLTFLLSVSDHLIIVMDSFCLDVNLFKLLATSLMMVGDALMAKANIIIYFRTSTNQNLEQQQQQQSSLYSIDFETRFRRFTETILGPNVNVDFIHNDEQRLINKVLRPPNSRSLVNLEQSCASINYHSEHQWFQSAQKFWDTSILKSTLFADYARYLP